MKIKTLLGLFVRVVVSVVFAGIFYLGWMVVAVPVLKSGPLLAKVLCWFMAPVVTAAGFAIGIVLFELLPVTRKSKLCDIILWPLTGCAIGAAIVFPFGPILIVFAMFGLGTAAILKKELLAIRKQTNPCISGS